MRPVCFLSDFGLTDDFVGTCKGVMVRIAPGINVIDLTHDVPGFEVEAALLEHPLVAECAVIAAPDEQRGHVVKAFVVVSEAVEASVLQDHVKASIAPYKYPRVVEFVSELPRTPTGKVQRNVLRKRSS